MPSTNSPNTPADSLSPFLYFSFKGSCDPKRSWNDSNDLWTWSRMTIPSVDRRYTNTLGCIFICHALLRVCPHGAQNATNRGADYITMLIEAVWQIGMHARGGTRGTRTLRHICSSLHILTRRTNEPGLLRCGVLTGKGNVVARQLGGREECL
jgi:hypothetical protein